MNAQFFISKKLRLLWIFWILPGFFAFSNVVTATSDGDWTNGGTWDTGSAPSCGDTIIVPVGITIDVNQTQNLDGCGLPTFILVEGTLDFANGKKIYLAAGSGVTVTETGLLTDGGGGGKANVISIGGVDVWTSSEGDILDPTTLGVEFGVEIKTITSGDFNVASTWDCNCIPDSTNVATILAAHTVTITSNAYIFDLNIQGILEIQGSNELYVRNTWNNTGSFVKNESTVSFGGIGGRSLTGIRNQEFYNLHVKNGCDLSNDAGLLNLEGILTFDNGTFNTNDSLYLISDANGTGAIGSMSSGSISGNVFSNRYVMAGATGWRFLTSCIQGATLEDIDDDIITSGLTGSDFPTFPFVSVWDYDETVPGHKDSGYVVPPSMSQSIGAGKGYWIYAGDNLSGTAAFNIDFYGVVNQGNIGLPVSYTNSGDSGDGWNLVANPYPCSIDWDDANWTKTNISDETHIFDPNTGTYAVYAAGVGANGGSNVISSNQAFWIKATATSPQLTATEDCKVSDNSDPFKSQLVKRTLHIYCSKTNSSDFKDEIVLVAERDSENSILARKMLSTNDSVLNIMFNPSSSLSSILGHGNRFDTIPLRLIGNSTNTYISFKDKGFLEDFWSVYLYDHATSNKYLITGDISFDLGKNVIDSNSDLSLIIVPKAQIDSKHPFCEASENGQIMTNIYGMDDHISLTNLANNNLLNVSNGESKNIGVGTYLIHMTEPINNTDYYDSIIVISPINSGINQLEYGVAQLSEDIFIDQNFKSNSWTVNGVEFLLDSYEVSMSEWSHLLTQNDMNLIQCVMVDTIGCKSAYQWSLFYNNPALVYPNPYSAENPLNVFVYEGENNIKIYNLKGQIITNLNVSSAFEQYIEINELDLSAGQYIVAVESELKVKYFKLMVNE